MASGKGNFDFDYDYSITTTTTLWVQFTPGPPSILRHPGKGGEEVILRRWRGEGLVLGILPAPDLWYCYLLLVAATCWQTSRCKVEQRPILSLSGGSLYRPTFVTTGTGRATGSAVQCKTTRAYSLTWILFPSSALFSFDARRRRQCTRMQLVNE